MTDNRTTELESLSKLKMAGRLRYWRGTIEIPETELHAICDEIQAEHEQAVAATLGGGTLTAEQVREAVMSADRWEKPMGDTGLTNTHLIIRDDGWQEIADELNAELGRGMCKFEHVKSGPMYDVWRCSVCGYEYAESVSETSIVQNFCPSCGKAVE